jgi:hypothetical protein
MKQYTDMQIAAVELAMISASGASKQNGRH